jgi:hypothetical protein
MVHQHWGQVSGGNILLLSWFGGRARFGRGSIVRGNLKRKFLLAQGINGQHLKTNIF